MTKTSSEKPPLSPLDVLGLIEESFLKHLEHAHLELSPAVLHGLPAAIRARIVELTPKALPLVRNDLDRGNVGYVLLAVAAYEVLLAWMPPTNALEAVDACLNEPMREAVLQGTAAMLDGSPDPFVAITAASRDREAHYFGPSFEFERPLDDDFGYVLNVRRCLYHETLKALGRTEVQPVLCRFDLNWIDAIDAERHRVSFARPSTFATANLCRWSFMRLEKPTLLRTLRTKSETLRT